MGFDFVKVKSTFFDSPAVKKAIDKGTKKALSKCGAYVRTKSKTSLRYKDKPSKPGAVPSVHRSGKFTRTTVNRKTGASVTRATSPLKELIFFGYDAGKKSVAIGPVAFNKKTGTPSRLEHGGSFQITRAAPLPKGRKASGKQAASFRRLIQEGRITLPPRNRISKTITIEPRQFMGPALKSEVTKFPETFQNVIRR